VNFPEKGVIEMTQSEISALKCYEICDNASCDLWGEYPCPFWGKEVGDIITIKIVEKTP
jgi:hypothetical protein